MKKIWRTIILICMMSVCVVVSGCANSASKSDATQNEETQHMESQSADPQDTESQISQNKDNSASDGQEPYMVSFTANTIDGQEFSSEQFGESKVTMINVWATYCNPCLAEMPDLGKIAESYDKANFQIVGVISDVVEDSPQSDLDNAKDLIVQTEANYPHLLLNQSLFENLVGGVSSVPTTFFVDSKGEMLGYVVGANDKDTWQQIIDELLAKEGVLDD